MANQVNQETSISRPILKVATLISAVATIISAAAGNPDAIYEWITYIIVRLSQRPPTRYLVISLTHLSLLVRSFGAVVPGFGHRVICETSPPPRNPSRVRPGIHYCGMAVWNFWRYCRHLEQARLGLSR